MFLLVVSFVCVSSFGVVASVFYEALRRDDCVLRHSVISRRVIVYILIVFGQQ